MAKREQLIDSLKVEIELAEKAGASAKVIKAMERDALAIQRVVNSIEAKGPTEAMAKLERAVQAMGGTARLTEPQVARLVDRINSLKAAGAEIPQTLQPIVENVARRVQAETRSLEGLIKSIADRGSVGSGVAGYLQNLAESGGIGAAAGPVGAGIAAAGVVVTGTAAALGELVQKTIAHADALKTEAATAQVSMELMQRMRFALREANADVSAATTARVNFNKALSESPENFQKWGLSVTALRDMKPEEQMQAIADTLSSISTESERAAAANDIFGKAGAEMLKAMTAGWRETTAAASEYGAVMSEQDLSDLESLGSAWERMGGAVESFGLQIGNAVAKAAGVQDLAAGVDLLARAVGALGSFVDRHSDKITGLFAYLAGLSPTTLAGLAGARALVGMAIGPQAGPDVTPTRDMVAYRSVLEGLRKSSEGLGKVIEAEDRRAADAAKEKAKWDADELSRIEERDKAYRKFLEARIAVNDAEEMGLMIQRAKLARDERGGAYNGSLDALIGKPDRNAEIAIPPEVLARTAAMASAQQIMEAARAREQEKTQADAVAKLLEKQGWSQEQINEALGRTVDQTMTWAQFGQVVANQLSSMGQLGGTIGKVLGGVAGIGAMFDKGGPLEGGIGKIFSGGLKGAAGGITAGLAAFDVGKMLYSVLHKTEAQKVAFDVGRDYGVKISEGLAKEIADKSKTMGREAASLLSLDKIVAEGGGVSAFGVEKTAAKLHDLFSQIQTGKITAEQAKKPFDALFGEVAQQSISKTTGLVSQQVRELMALANASGMQSDAVAKFRDEQRAIAEGILGRLADSKTFKVANEGAAQAFGGAIAARFRAMIEQGLSGAEIADKLGPEVDKLQAKLAESGFGGGAAFDGMVAKLAMFRDELTGPTAQSISDVGALAAALYNSGDLTRDQFAGLASQIGTDFTTLQKQLAEQGKDPADAYGAMSGELQKLWEMQRRYNVTLDETTANILKQAEADGTVGVERMSAQDRMAEGIERLGDIMQRTGEALGASFDDLPARARTAARGVNDALAGISPPDLALQIPTDMSPYGPAGGILTDMPAMDPEQLGVSVGDAVAPGLESVGDGVRALAQSIGGIAAQPIQTTTVIKLEDGAVGGTVTNAIERGGPTGVRLVTAVEEALKRRGWKK